ncbi:hypothetical protein [Streptomyces griseomycini]|uniref:Uncharacterized protein n=1 Tax=Streptomyces griseomycini TaxID=66895 RepID=A0A7W7PUV8_9ACTN|nr:hypothetical protein [Streptomyces griseomycini]MBB4901719.1 hypothetical protein [Streptomyces griseomycini]GGR50132.1 hypothetical protein GCM10015536_64690 [Streptomyces griseomycini]
MLPGLRLSGFLLLGDALRTCALRTCALRTCALRTCALRAGALDLPAFGLGGGQFLVGDGTVLRLRPADEFPQPVLLPLALRMRLKPG